MDSHSDHKANKEYVLLTLMAVISFVAMYFLMYAMVNTWSNVFPSYNQFYMAGLMASPMVILELLLMKQMYRKKRWNAIILVVSIVALAFFWVGIRGQKGIGDEQFLKSMIPHHAGAILMCEKANLKDAEIKELCQNIISGQQSEIDFMKAKLQNK